MLPDVRFRERSLGNWEGLTRDEVADRLTRVTGDCPLVTVIGGRLIAYYMTFGEYDFLSIAEAPNDVQMAAALLAAGSGGGVTDLKTTLALTSIEAKGAFAAASDLAPSFKSPGGT